MILNLKDWKVSAGKRFSNPVVAKQTCLEDGNRLSFTTNQNIRFLFSPLKIILMRINAELKSSSQGKSKADIIRFLNSQWRL